VELAINHCTLLPADVESDIASIVLLPAAGIVDLLDRVATLLDHLDQMLEDVESIIMTRRAILT
jgi:hypothetical protein